MCTWSKRDKMRIAIFGWGSLIWCPGSLKLATRWFRDGPMLPVEFARISKGDPVTLVVHRDSRDQRTLWAIGDSDSICAAQDSLREREGTPRNVIHCGSAGGEYSPTVSERIRSAISEWLRAH